MAEKRREELVEAARAKITPDGARTQILSASAIRCLPPTAPISMRDRRAVTAAIENLHDKYSVRCAISRTSAARRRRSWTLSEGAGLCLNALRKGPPSKTSPSPLLRRG